MRQRRATLGSSRRHQGPYVLVASQAPGVYLLLNDHLQPCRRCSIPAESPRVSLLPNQSSDEKEDGVETTASGLRDQFSATQPPLHNRLLLYDNNFLKMKLPEPMIPNFSAEATAKQDVFHRLNSLIVVTHDGDLRLLDTDEGGPFLDQEFPHDIAACATV